MRQRTERTTYVLLKVHKPIVLEKVASPIITDSQQQCFEQSYIHLCFKYIQYV